MLGNEVEVVVKVCFVLFVTCVICFLIVAAWMYIFDWWYGNHNNERNDDDLTY